MIKFKDLKADDGLNALAELSISIGTLIADSEFTGTVDEIAKIYTDKKNKNKLKSLIKPILIKFIPLLTNKYRAELYSIVATIDGVTVDELKKISIVEFINKVFAILNDEDFLGFFSSSDGQEQSEQ